MFHTGYYKHVIVQNIMQVNEVHNYVKCAKEIFNDTETSGFRVRFPGNDFMCGLTLAFDDETDKRVFYLPVAHEFEGEYTTGRIDYKKLGLNPKDFPDFKEEELCGEYYNLDLDLVRPIIHSMFKNSAIKVAHNGSFDWHVCANEGADIDYMLDNLYYDDTMVMFHTLDEESEKKLEKIVHRTYGLYKTDFDDVVATVTLDEKKSVGFKGNQKVPYQYCQIPIGGRYSCEDVWFTKQLYYDLKEALVADETYDPYLNLRRPFMAPIWRMERTGVKLDKKRAAEMQVKAEKELENIKYKMFELAGIEFNLNSDQQLREMLFGHKKVLKDSDGEYYERYNENIVAKSFGLPVLAWTNGGKDRNKKLKNPQADAKTLEKYMDMKFKDKRQLEGLRFIKLLMRYNHLVHLYNNYIVGFQKAVYQDGRVRASFNICGTDGGRISSNDPNVLNMPRPQEKPKEPKKENFPDEKAYKFELNRYIEEKEEYDFWIQFEIRSLIIPEEGNVIIAGDKNNIEKRLSAVFANDKNMIEMFEKGYDGHGFVATLVFPECKGMHPNDVKKLRPDLRQWGKSLGFLLDYGGTEYGLAPKLGVSKERARELIDAYYSAFDGLSSYYDAQTEFARNNGFIYSLLGRKRHMKDINSYDQWIRARYERLVKNFPPQGGTADIMMCIQTDMDRDPVFRRLGCRMILQIYDEVVCECPEKYKYLFMDKIKYHMENAAEKRLKEPLRLPIPVGIDFSLTSYAEAK